MSAVLLPHRSSTEIDWPAFEVHVDRTAAAGLTPAAKHGHRLRAPPQPRAVAEVLRRTKVLGVGPTAPPEVSGLEEVQQFPLLAGTVLVVLGVIATSPALIVTVRRRRLELGVLSALGFAPAQRRAVILGQATTITMIALVVGMPLGAVVGRVVWSAIAGSMGLATDASFPLALLAAVHIVDTTAESSSVDVESSSVVVVESSAVDSSAVVESSAVVDVESSSTVVDVRPSRCAGRAAGAENALRGLRELCGC